MSVVREKYDQFKAALSSLLSDISNNDQAKKLESNNRLRKVAQDLSDILAVEDRPAWLNRTVTVTANFAKENPKPNSIRSGSSWRLLSELIAIYSETMGHVWNFEEDSSDAYNFDEVYQRARKSSKLDELFDSLISELEILLNTGEIDSIKAIDSLKKLMKTLSENKNGSYFSTIASWQFLQSFTKNIIWESLNKVPGVQSSKVAFEKTLNEMDIEMDRLHDEITSELQERFSIKPNESLKHDSGGPQLIGDKRQSTDG
jgi:glycogen synthase